jgi:transposase InsO family protein
MTNDLPSITHSQRWARFRFSIIGVLLAAPPDKGELQSTLRQLANREWIHPIYGHPFRIGMSTLERWYYRAREEQDPVGSLKQKLRIDSGLDRSFSPELKQQLRQQYAQHASWSVQLHVDNLAVLVKQNTQLGRMPSYSTVRRFMKANGLIKQKRVRQQKRTAGMIAAENRLETREVRSYEVDYVHGLWHLDYHHGSLKILTSEGQWVSPVLLAVMDDRSRLICHAQWFLYETTENLVHGFMQALQKRALPRELMSDNGAAMTSQEFTQGLEHLGILHQLTLPYSPYQNAKQEFFWVQVEGRLLPMLEGETDLTLDRLNLATQAWAEKEYHHKRHSELGCTPMERYLQDAHVGRNSPVSQELRQAFQRRVVRKQRRSDGTVSVDGKRFEVPSRYRNLERVHVRYAQWDLSWVEMVDAHSHTLICRLFPLDKSANATGLRRTLTTVNESDLPSPRPTGVAPLLKQLMADYAATGHPPAYLPKEESNA